MEDPAPNLRKRRVRSWHRILGAMTALPLVWVMITGAVLNHTVDWKLDQMRLVHPWILRAYGMTPAGDPEGMTLGSRHVAAWDGQVFLDGLPLETTGSLLGTVPDGGGLAVVTNREVLRLDSSGATVESLGTVFLPELPLLGVAGHEGRVYLKNHAGWHEVGADWMEFSPAPGLPLAKQMLTPIHDKASRRRLEQAWSRGGLPASRVVLDLHAGRFLGSFSRWFYDFVVICTLWLCASGMILLLRKPRRNR